MEVFKNRLENGLSSNAGKLNEVLKLYDLNTNQKIDVPKIENVPQYKRFNKLRTIQKYSLGAIEQKNVNVLGISPTGTGKTIAFLLPTFLKMNKEVEVDPHVIKPKIVIISPTRVLRKQTFKVCEEMVKDLDLDVVVREYDDADVLSSRDKILRGKRCDVLVTLITDFWNVFQRPRGIWISLDMLEFMIVDEADIHFTELADESSSLIYNVLGICKNQSKKVCRFLLYSASFPSDILQNLKTILSSYEFKVIEVKNKGHSIEKSIIASENLYLDCLNMLIDLPVCRTVVFVETEQDISTLYQGYLKDLKAVCLSGNLQQTESQQILEKFSNGEYHILITKPSSFSRGVHVDNVRLVVILGLKSLVHNLESLYTRFQHACGRTGRSYQSGNVLLLTPISVTGTSQVVNDILFHDSFEENYQFSDDVMDNKKVEYLIDQKIIQAETYFKYVYSQLRKIYSEYKEILNMYIKYQVPEFKNLEHQYPINSIDFKDYVYIALQGRLNPSKDHIEEVSKIENTGEYILKLEELERHTETLRKITLYIEKRDWIKNHRVPIEYIDKYNELDKIKFLREIYAIENKKEAKEAILINLNEETRKYNRDYGPVELELLDSEEFELIKEYNEQINLITKTELGKKALVYANSLKV